MGFVVRKRTAALAGAVFMSLLGAGAVATTAAADSGRDTGRERAALFRVGAASRSVLPTVGGSHDYLRAVHPDPADPFAPGLFVPA